MRESRKQLLERCRRGRDTQLGGDLRALLRLAAEECREDLVTARPEDVPALQGAVRKLRQVLRWLEQDPPEVGQEDGAYN